MEDTSIFSRILATEKKNTLTDDNAYDIAVLAIFGMNILYIISSSIIAKKHVNNRFYYN